MCMYSNKPKAVSSIDAGDEVVMWPYRCLYVYINIYVYVDIVMPMKSHSDLVDKTTKEMIAAWIYVYKYIYSIYLSL